MAVSRLLLLILCSLGLWSSFNFLFFTSTSKSRERFSDRPAKLILDGSLSVVGKTLG